MTGGGTVAFAAGRAFGFTPGASRGACFSSCFGAGSGGAASETSGETGLPRSPLPEPDEPTGDIRL